VVYLVSVFLNSLVRKKVIKLQFNVIITLALVIGGGLITPHRSIITGQIITKENQMKAINLTNTKKKAIVDDSIYDSINIYKWRMTKNGYAVRGLANKGNYKTILMHRYITDTPKGYDTDHINQNKLDNRKSNLRICTRSENNCNSKLRKGNTTGYRGISIGKDGKYEMQISYKGKRIVYKRYKNIKDAVKSYNCCARILHGEYAYLNEV